MTDDALSASQLRQRYHAGGTASDADLTARQLRARYGIASNRPDFSTGETGVPTMVVVAAIGVALAFAAFVLLKTWGKAS